MTDEEKAIEYNVQALAQWASCVAFDAIPDDVKRRAAMVIADDLACAVGSRDEPEIRALKARLPYSAKEATIFLGDAAKTDRASAAMINAIASNWCQLDEGHRQVMCHAGLYVVPPALAEAEAESLDMRDLLRATVIGYEVVCRFAQAFRFAKPTAHPHAIWSPLGAATAIAALRAFDESCFFDAMTTAITVSAAGPFGHAVEGALVANGWAGLGVATGFRCADLVQCGIAGLATSPSGVLVSVLGAAPRVEALIAGLGQTWALNGGYHKVHSCAQQSHGAVEAMLAIVARWPNGKAIRDISHIIVEGHPLALAMDNRSPATTLAARFSIPHIVAVVCAHGRADAAAFSSDTLLDEDIARLRTLVELKLREPLLATPHDRAARVTIQFADGTIATEECLSAEGGPDRPVSDQKILEKCAALTGSVYPNFKKSAQHLCAIDEALWKWRVGDFVQHAIAK